MSPQTAAMSRNGGILLTPSLQRRNLLCSHLSRRQDVTKQALSFASLPSRDCLGTGYKPLQSARVWLLRHLLYSEGKWLSLGVTFCRASALTQALKFLFIMDTHMCVHMSLHVPCICRGQKKGTEPRELGFPVVRAPHGHWELNPCVLHDR